jgi:hypothetical protein
MKVSNSDSDLNHKNFLTDFYFIASGSGILEKPCCPTLGGPNFGQLKLVFLLFVQYRVSFLSTIFRAIFLREFERLCKVLLNPPFEQTSQKKVVG